MRRGIKILVIISILLYQNVILIAQNQVGINTNTPHASSVFEVVSINKGMLIPRMSSNNRLRIQDPEVGLVVYDLNLAAFMYYNGGFWSQLGNSGQASDAISDADNDTRITAEISNNDNRLRFYTQGVEYFRFEERRIDIRNTGNSVFMGSSAGINDDLSNNLNVFIGYETGRLNVTGFRNVVLGSRAMHSGTTMRDVVAIGSNSAMNGIDYRESIAIGSNSLQLNVNSIRNIAIGYNAMNQHVNNTNNLGIGNQSLFDGDSARFVVAVGNSSLSSCEDCSHFVAVGYQSGISNSTGNNDIFLGYQAGGSFGGNNRLIIENTSLTQGLIWANFNSDSLVINGSLLVTNNIYYVGTLTDASDRRLKENFEPINGVLENLTQLGVYKYNLKSDSLKTKEIGLIAQEVQQYFPYAVREIRPNDDILGVSYLQLTPIILQAIKEQKEALKNQHQEVKALNNSIEDLERKLSLLKQGKSLSVADK